MGRENAVITARAMGVTVAKRMQRRVQGARAMAIMGVTMTGLLAGCSSVPAALNPVEWWHGLQGGAIAEQRPAPPGADDPFPNLASVPARPPASDPKLRQQIADALVADRGNAQHDAAGVQLADPSNPAASPTLFGRGSVPPPAPAPSGGASATLAAAGQAAAAPASPPPMATEQPSGGSRVASGNATPAALETRDEPASRAALPIAPPAPANLPGAPASAPVRSANPTAAIPTSTVATSATPTGETAVNAPGTTQNNAGRGGAASVGVPFTLGSAVVPRASLPALRQLATRRASATIAVTGYGEAAGSDAATQSAALSLALARAQAVAAALTAAGVPASAMRVDAAAAGRGAAARLVE